MTRLFPLPPDLRVPDLPRILYAQWQPDLTPAEVAMYADAHNVLSNVTPDLLRVQGTPEHVELDWLASLEADWQAPWSPAHGIQPAPGALGLSIARLEVVVQGDTWLRWIRIGSPAIAAGHEGRRFAQVFTRVERGADGQPHYGGEAGVYRIADGTLMEGER